MGVIPFGVDQGCLQAGHRGYRHLELAHPLGGIGTGLETEGMGLKPYGLWIVIDRLVLNLKVHDLDELDFGLNLGQRHYLTVCRDPQSALRITPRMQHKVSKSRFIASGINRYVEVYKIKHL